MFMKYHVQSRTKMSVLLKEDIQSRNHDWKYGRYDSNSATKHKANRTRQGEIDQHADLTI